MFKVNVGMQKDLRVDVCDFLCHFHPLAKELFVGPCLHVLPSLRNEIVYYRTMYYRMMYKLVHRSIVCIFLQYAITNATCGHTLKSYKTVYI